MLVGVIFEVVSYAHRDELAMLVGVRDVRVEKAILVGVIAEVDVKSKRSNPNPDPK